MSIDIQEYNAQLTTVTKSTLKVVPIRGDLVAYKLTANRSHAHEGQFRITRPAMTSANEGIAYRCDIDAFLARADADEKALSLNCGISESPWRFFTQMGRDQLARRGMLRRDKGEEEIFKSALIDNPYTALVNGEVTANDLAYFCGGAGVVFDADLNPLPVGIYMDYIEARLNNQMYDLQKAAQILRARSDIQFFNDRGEIEDPSKESVICDIPYYNRERDRNRCMYVLWTPSPEDMKAIWQKCQQIRPPKKLRKGELIDSYPFVEKLKAIFDLDLLGLRAGGAVLCKDFYYGRDSSVAEDSNLNRAEDFDQFDEDDD